LARFCDNEKRLFRRDRQVRNFSHAANLLWGQAQAVPNHSSYRLPANTTLRKIKAHTKADRHPGNDAYIKAASDERDGLLNDSNQK
jgi:hypothetical protein